MNTKLKTETPELIFFYHETEADAKVFMNRQMTRQYFDAEYIGMYYEAKRENYKWVVHTAGDNRFYNMKGRK